MAFKDFFFTKPGFDFEKLNRSDSPYLIEMTDIKKSFLLVGESKKKNRGGTLKTRLQRFFFKPAKHSEIELTDENSIEVLHGINIKIKRGEMVAIMGVSGSGKSTLMNIIGTLDKASSGEYLFAGENITKFSRQDLAKLRNRQIGFVFQSFNLLSKVSVAKNVMRPMMYAQTPLAQRAPRVKEMLDMVDLYDKKDSGPLRLSGGQQQRVALARALVMKPGLILADEPTGALDSKTAQMVMEELRRINQETGTTIILVTHDSKTASYADRTIYVKDGLIVGKEVYV